jgi:hypothetical protein
MSYKLIIKGEPSDTLPEKGWIHPCIICNIPTAREFYYYYIYKVYRCYFCKDCLKDGNYINLYYKEILLKVYK